MRIELVDKNNFDLIKFPKNLEADYACSFWEGIIKNGSVKYLKNVDVAAYLLIVDEQVLPIVKTNLLAKNNCYVANPSAQYIDYCLEELKELKNSWLENLLKIMIKEIGKVLSISEFNKVVYVNNWLLSTNLYANLSNEEIEKINIFLSRKFPQTMIMYRSLNYKTNSSLIESLEKLGAKKILSRQVYMADPKDSALLGKTNFKRDLKFLKTTPLEIQESDITEESAEIILEQYNQLYLEKYSYLNPQFSLEFMKNAVSKKLFNFKLVKENGKAIASLGYFSRNGVMTPPIFGFNLKDSNEKGLYRILSSLVAQDSQKKGLLVNYSSGASQFKELRGAKPELEYSFYFYNNCSFKQKSSWFVLSFLANTIGAYFIKRYRL